MTLQLSRYPSSEAKNHGTGPAYTWHIEKNVAEPVALAMLPALAGQIAERGLLLLVCDASITPLSLKLHMATIATRAILRSYYYKTDQPNLRILLLEAIQDGVQAANDEIAQQSLSEDGIPLENRAGLSVTAIVARGNKLLVGSLGDTTAFRLHNAQLAQYQQGQAGQMLILEDQLRDGDRVFVCTQAFKAACGTGRIRVAANETPVSNETLRTLIESAEQVTSTDILAAAVLCRDKAAPIPLAANQPAPRTMRLLTLACAVVLVAALAGLLVMRQRLGLSLELNPRVALAPAPTATRAVRPTETISPNDLTVLEPIDLVATADSSFLAIPPLVETATPQPTLVATPTTLSPSLLPSQTPLPTPTLTPQTTPEATKTTRPKVKPATATPDPAKKVVTIVPPRATAVPQPTAAPAQPTSPPEQPTSVPPQPTSPPPQPTSPPEQPTSPPPQPTTPPQPTPDVGLPCPPGAQCNP